MPEESEDNVLGDKPVTKHYYGLYGPELRIVSFEVLDRTGPAYDDEGDWLTSYGSTRPLRHIRSYACGAGCGNTYSMNFMDNPENVQDWHAASITKFDPISGDLTFTYMKRDDDSIYGPRDLDYYYVGQKLLLRMQYVDDSVMIAKKYIPTYSRKYYVPARFEGENPVVVESVSSEGGVVTITTKNEYKIGSILHIANGKKLDSESAVTMDLTQAGSIRGIINHISPLGYYIDGSSIDRGRSFRGAVKDQVLGNTHFNTSPRHQVDGRYCSAIVTFIPGRRGSETDYYGVRKDSWPSLWRQLLSWQHDYWKVRFEGDFYASSAEPPDPNTFLVHSVRMYARITSGGV